MTRVRERAVEFGGGRKTIKGSCPDRTNNAKHGIQRTKEPSPVGLLSQHMEEAHSTSSASPHVSPSPVSAAPGRDMACASGERAMMGTGRSLCFDARASKNREE